MRRMNGIERIMLYCRRFQERRERWPYASEVARALRISVISVDSAARASRGCIKLTTHFTSRAPAIGDYQVEIGQPAETCATCLGIQTVPSGLGNAPCPTCQHPYIEWPSFDELGRPTRGCTRGGHLAEVPKPLVRLYSRPYKREVTIAMYQFPGNRHWYVDIDEDDDRVWDSSPYFDGSGHPNGWRICWDDKEGKGRDFHGRYCTLAAAVRFVETIRNRWFPSKTHVLVNRSGKKWSAKCPTSL